MNHPIQSAAASVMYLALLLCEKELNRLGIYHRWLGTVYDEMLIEYKPEDSLFVKALLTK